MSEISDARTVPPEVSPLFVFGADHSGTTILYRMLAYHPDLTWFSQFSLRGGEVPGRRGRPIVDRLDPLLRFLPHPWRKEDSALARLVIPHPGEENAIWAYLLEGEATGAATRVRSCLATLSERHGRKRVLAKWPAFYRHLDLLRAAFPNARFVHVVRDGRPVALSLRAKDIEVRAKHGRQPGNPEGALGVAARYWVEVLARTDATFDHDLIEVRYEDFCSDVHGAIHGVLQGADLEVGSFPFGRCPSSLTSRNSYWLDQASRRELVEISQIQSDPLIRRGYPVDLTGLETTLPER